MESHKTSPLSLGCPRDFSLEFNGVKPFWQWGRKLFANLLLFNELRPFGHSDLYGLHKPGRNPSTGHYRTAAIFSESGGLIC